ncbi:hypothetical protein DFJ77DRAFT_453663 [Powellomyces hirtus]|nr:hypothetical protein DFJ77DRAFT_453663 [Powellomyces hirtus]
MSSVDKLLRIARRDKRGVEEVVQELVGKGRVAACRYIKSLYETVVYVKQPASSVAKASFQLLTRPNLVIELPDREHALALVTAEICVALDLTLQELEEWAPRQAVPHIILALNTPEAPSNPHPGRNSMVLLCRYLLRLALSKELVEEDLAESIKQQCEFIQDALEALREEMIGAVNIYELAVICQLSSEVGEYYFETDNFRSARHYFRISVDIMQAHGTALKSQPFCTVDLPRITSCIKACCAGLSVASKDIDAPELTERSKALAVITRCRHDGEYGKRELETLFLWDKQHNLVPVEVKHTIVEEAYVKGFMEPAARLGICVGLSTGGTADSMVKQVPAQSVLVLKMFTKNDRMFDNLISLFEQAVDADAYTGVAGQTGTPDRQRFVSFVELLCRRVDRFDMWTSVAQFVYTDEFHAHVNSLRSERAMEMELKNQPPKAIPFFDPQYELRMRLLTVLNDEDIDQLEKINVGVPIPQLVMALYDNMKYSYAEGEYGRTEKLLIIILRLCNAQSTQPFTESQLRELSIMGHITELSKMIIPYERDASANGSGDIMRVLEVLYRSLGTDQFLPDFDFMKRLFSILIKLGQDGIYDYLKLLASRVWDLVNARALQDVERAGVLCFLIEMVSQCMQMFSVWTVADGPDDVKVLTEIVTKRPELIAVIKDAANKLALAIGDPNPTLSKIAQAHLISILTTVGSKANFRAVGHILAGVARALQREEQLGRISIFGPLVHLTNIIEDPGPIDPATAQLLPIMHKVTAAGASPLTPEMGPRITAFLRDLFSAYLKFQPNDRELHFAMGDICCAQGLHLKALSYYMDGLAVHSSNFATTLLLDTDKVWLFNILPRMAECAALCQEYFTSVVLSQLCPNPNVNILLENLELALTDIANDEIQLAEGIETQSSEYTYLVEDRGFPDGVISSLWNHDLLEYAVGFFKRAGDLVTIKLLIDVIGRQDLSPVQRPPALESYMTMVLSRFLKHARRKILDRVQEAETAGRTSPAFVAP